MDANAKSMRQEIKRAQAEIRSTVNDFKEKMDAMIANIKDAWKKTTACQEVTRANPENLESNSGEKETAVEQQEIYNEEVTVHSPRACRCETAASQEATKTEPEPGTM
jgi:hypothetical protein